MAPLISRFAGLGFAIIKNFSNEKPFWGIPCCAKTGGFWVTKRHMGASTNLTLAGGIACI